MTHRIGPIHPENGQPARFLQVYFLDSSMVLRDDYRQDLNASTIAMLRELQRTHNTLLRDVLRVYDEISMNRQHDNNFIL